MKDLDWLTPEQERIIRRYVAGESGPQIGASTGQTHHSVYKLLKAAHIQRRPRGGANNPAGSQGRPNPYTHDQLLSLLRTYTAAELAKVRRVGRAVIRRWARELGIDPAACARERQAQIKPDAVPRRRKRGKRGRR